MRSATEADAVAKQLPGIFRWGCYLCAVIIVAQKAKGCGCGREGAGTGGVDLGMRGGRHSCA